jgi:DNA-directed RNA polymerase alpha subunit
MITLETKIQNTDLDTSIKNILSRCYIYDINDLVKTDIPGLKRIRGLGIERVKEILNFMHDNGLYFN